MRNKIKLVAGVGINDWPDSVYEDVVLSGGGVKKKALKSYTVWSQMLNRCYNKSHPAYKDYHDVSVCEEWLTFSNFELWYSLHNSDGMDIDKDLWREGNKEYSPETCLIVSRRVNVAARMRSKSKKGLKIGVATSGSGRFNSKIMNDTGKYTSLGVFDTAHEAHKAWQIAKIRSLLDLAKTQTDDRVINGLHRIASKIQCEVDNGMETIKLDRLSIVENK